MPDSFSRQIVFNKTTVLAVIVPQLRRDGMHFEVNVKGYPRFFMAWSALGRYDLIDSTLQSVLPYELILAVSDEIEARKA